MAASLALISAGVAAVAFQHRVNGCAEETGLLDLGHVVERAHDGHCLGRPYFQDRPAFEDLLHFDRRAQRGEAAGVNERDAMAALSLVEVMRGDEDRHAFLSQHVDEAPELAARQRIDAAGRLIEKENRRLVKNRAAERQALTPAAREVARERILTAGQTGHLEHEAPPRRQTFRAQTVNAAEELDVLIDGQEFIEREALGHVADPLFDGFGIGRDVDAAHEGRAGRRPQEPAQHSDGRGLSSTITAEKAEDLAAPDVERQPVDGKEGAEAPRQVSDLNGVRSVNRWRHDGVSGRRRVRGGLQPSARSRAPWSARVRPAEAPSARRALPYW